MKSIFLEMLEVVSLIFRGNSVEYLLNKSDKALPCAMLVVMEEPLNASIPDNIPMSSKTFK